MARQWLSFTTPRSCQFDVLRAIDNPSPPIPAHPPNKNMKITLYGQGELNGSCKTLKCNDARVCIRPADTVLGVKTNARTFLSRAEGPGLSDFTTLGFYDDNIFDASQSLIIFLLHCNLQRLMSDFTIIKWNQICHLPC